MAVRIVTDSACDLPPELAERHGIAVVPLTIRFGDEEFVDRRDLTPEEFWARCAASPVLPSTAAPAPGAFEEAFRAAAAGGAEGVVCVNLSSELSATMASARTAAAAAADAVPVKVIDSRTLTVGLGLLCVEAARVAQAGGSLDEVAEAVESRIGRTRVYAALDTLENLRKGGRIGAAQAFIGSVLSIKPIIEVSKGFVEPESRQRTRAKSLRHLVDKVREAHGVEHLAVAHAAAPDVGDFLAQLGEVHPPEDTVVAELGPVVGAHAGPRTIGVTFQVPG